METRERDAAGCGDGAAEDAAFRVPQDGRKLECVGYALVGGQEVVAVERPADDEVALAGGVNRAVVRLVVGFESDGDGEGRDVGDGGIDERDVIVVDVRSR